MIPTTPDLVKGFLKDAGLDFSKYDKYQCKNLGIASGQYLIHPLLYYEGPHKTWSWWLK